MSSLCVLFQRDGSPAVAATLERMLDASPGTESGHIWTAGPIGMAHRPWHAIPNEAPQPLRALKAPHWIAVDGRLDDRAALAAALNLEQRAPDAELFLAAYQRWGDQFPFHVLGDFGLSLWDEGRQTLLLARDIFGVKPLFYCEQGPTFYVASTIGAILAALSERPPLHDAFVVDFLRWTFPRWNRETIYQGIYRLPPAHTLTVRPTGTCQLQRYWHFEGASPRPVHDRAEISAQLRHLLQAAVHDRLASPVPVALTLSGGLDSSTIACLASQAGPSETTPSAASFRLYSATFRDSASSPEADEAHYVDAVRSLMPHVPFIEIQGDDHWAFQTVPAPYNHRDEPSIFPAYAMLAAWVDHVRRDGSRVLLSGEGGDQICGIGGYQFVSYLLAMPFHRWAEELPFFVHRLGKRFPWELVATAMRDGLGRWPPLLDWGYRRHQRLTLPHWLKNQQHGWAVQHPLPSLPNEWPEQRIRRILLGQFTSGWLSALLQELESIARSVQIDYRYPFLDRRVVEFMTSLPVDLHLRGGWSKMVLREAMRDSWPSELFFRQGKSSHYGLFTKGILERERPLVHALVEASQKDQQRWIDGQAWALEYHRLEKTQSLQRPLITPLMLQWWFTNCSIPMPPLS